ncbi:GNAT family N-acetyltransferase [Idiomarina abyssalis]|uniref:GNAT family N-acetyltransferase n=1 Tax=Idiomarina abyssalis TaxID=86102 RepID=A0A8I1KHJ6_9GAMM|nr:GNAT family N-acetyltransferase [Idiomarina abyssalis]MBJ7265448.1 GNAT family N-acetyltransferase [Idiomarina abyssalis]MBJ7316878.1 GNAT family N-acetyltransferase [Idiomarina abyssalis]
MQYTVENDEHSEKNRGRLNAKSFGGKTPAARFGYLNWTIENGVMHIDDLFVIEEQRQYGIGSDLLDMMLRLAELKGVTEVCGLADKDDRLLHQFYKKHGFYFEEEPNERGELAFRLHFIEVEDE